MCLEPPLSLTDYDDALLERLGELIREQDPVPQDLKAAMRAALVTRIHPTPPGQRPGPVIPGEHC